METKISPLRQRLMDDLKVAMRAEDKTKQNTIRLLLSAIKYNELARIAPATDADIATVIAKEIKQRQESIEAFQKGNRPDLLAKEEAELAVLKSYMPQQMSREEVTAEVKKVIAEVGASSLKDKGKVMQKVMPQLKGKAEGKMIDQVVTELLSS